MNVKPGWQSSEMYVTIATALVTLVTVIYGLTPAQGAEAQMEVTKAISNVFALVAFAVTAYRYVAARETVKKAAIEQKGKVEVAQAQAGGQIAAAQAYAMRAGTSAIPLPGSPARVDTTE